MAKKVVSFMELIGTIFFLGLSVLVLVQVVMRYLFANPPVWTEEIARYCSIWSVFILGAVGVYEGAHVTMDFFVLMLPKGLQKLLVIIDGLIIIGFLVVLIKGGFEIAMTAYTSNQLATGSKIPFGIVYSILPIGGVLMLVFELMHIYAEFTKQGEKEAE